jgi:hypothetical protein
MMQGASSEWTVSNPNSAYYFFYSYTDVSPQSEHPNSEQFLKVTGFRGDGHADIQNVTHEANIVGQIWRSRDFCSGSITLYKETMQLGSNFLSVYSISSPGILRENIIWYLGI